MTSMQQNVQHRSLRILHINSYFSTSGLFKEVYDRQVAKGDDVDVYVPIANEYPEDRLATSGDYTTVARTFPQWTRWFFPVKHHYILNDLIKRYDFSQYDLIHAHSLFSNGWLAYQLHKRFGIPYIVSVRNADLRTFFEKMPWMKPIGQHILHHASCVVFISRSTQDQVLAKFNQAFATLMKAKSIVIPNGVNQFWHDNLFTDKAIRPLIHRQHPLKFVYTGKIVKTKRIKEVVKKIEHFAASFNIDCELHLIGEDWDKAYLQELLSFGFVHYHGKLDKEAIRDIYRQMDIFVMLSYPETFGLVYVEAMSQALPVLYSQGEGFDRFFPNGHIGMSVHPKSQASFDDALSYMIQHYSDMASLTTSSVAQFNWDDIVNRYTQLYQSVSKGDNYV